LFGSGLVVQEGVASGSRGITLPAQLVPSDGMITVPFVGRVMVKGRTVAQAQELIQTLLTGKTTSPQVIVTVPDSVAYNVTVSGEVVKGARLRLSPAGERLLDVIALAGGAQAPVYDVYVRLSRKGVTATIPYRSLVDKPAENIYAWPDDVLTLVRVPHTFEAFGATAQNNQIEFGQQELDLAQALAKTSGLVSDRSDPAGVFLLRQEPISLVRQLDAGADWQQPQVPVVYHLDFKDAKTYFLAQRFPIEDNDVLYVAPAKSDAIQKFFSLLGSLTSPIVTGVILNNDAH
jgi:polysaccharide biosynthesis/export protein